MLVFDFSDPEDREGFTVDHNESEEVEEEFSLSFLGEGGPSQDVGKEKDKDDKEGQLSLDSSCSPMEEIVTRITITVQ